jgi:hypothetical protein
VATQRVATINRRAFVLRLASVASALGLGTLAPLSPTRIARAQPTEPRPIPTRIGEVVQQGLAFRDGLAEGVRLPAAGGGWALEADRPGGRFTSEPLKIDFPSSHVGVHWRMGAGHGPLVELRTSRDGSHWSSWRRVYVEAHVREPQPPAGGPRASEQFGALVGGRLATWLQYRLTFPEAGEVSAGVERVTLTYLDARDPRGPHAEGPTPDLELASLRSGLSAFVDRVVTREQWGADESLRFKDGQDQWPRAFVAPKFLVVHHTAGENQYTDPAAEVRAIYTYHTVTQGWGDIGYHLLIDDRGQAFEGRIGRETSSGREVLSANVVAGHVLAYNYGSVGIALLGTFNDVEPSEPALQTLAEALAFEAERHAIDPTARVDFLRARSRTDSDTLWRDDLANVSGHRDCVPTECPGDRLYALLPTLRDRAVTRIGPPGPSAQITAGPPDRNLWPTDLVFRWAGLGGATEFSTRLGGWRLSSEPDRIVPLSGYAADEWPIWGPWSPARAASFALPPDARGSYTLHVRARGAGGREGAYAARWPLFVDRHVVADNRDAGRVSRTGAWRRTSDILGFNAADYEEAEPAGASADFTWTLDVPESGDYRVLACWTEGEFRTTNARFTISAGGRPLADVTVNQRERGGQWVELATVRLDSGTACRVELTNQADGVVVADAIRLVLI